MPHTRRDALQAMGSAVVIGLGAPPPHPAPAGAVPRNGSGGSPAGARLVNVGTVTELRDTAGDRPGIIALVGGYAELGDGGSGEFYWHPGATEPDNRGTVVGSLDAGRWKRLYDGPLNVQWFGVAGGGNDSSGGDSGDDSAAIQAAIDAAHAAGGGRVLFRSGAVYRVREIFLRPGVTVDLNHSTVKRVPNAGNRVRTFSVPETPGNPYRWGGAVDSQPVTVCNGTVDGDRPNQGPYTNYELQQSHLLFFDADPAQAGRLRVNLENLVLQDCVADGITTFRNVDINISNVRTVDCWRGGLVVGGGYTRVRVSQFTAGGYVHDSGIDVEVDEAGSEGYGGTKAVDIQMNSVWLQGDFDVLLQPGGVLVAENILCKKPGFTLGAYQSTVRISNSEFVVGTFSGPGMGGNHIVWPHDVTLCNCTFTVEPGAPDGARAPRSLAGVRVAWRAGLLAPPRQKLRLLDCVWKLGPGVKADDTTYAIVAEEDALSLGNELIVQGCEIPAGFDHGIFALYGLRATVKDTRLRAKQPIRWEANEGEAGIDLTLDGVDVRGAGFYMAAGNGYTGGGATKRIEHRNTVMDEADAGLSAAGGFHAATYVGGRTIYVNAPPAGRLAGMPGDVAVLKAPAAGQAWRWVCTTTDSLVSAAGTVWKPEAALGA